MLSKPGTSLTIFATRTNRKIVAGMGKMRFAHFPAVPSTLFHMNSKMASNALKNPPGTSFPLFTNLYAPMAIRMRRISANNVAKIVFVI